MNVNTAEETNTTQIQFIFCQYDLNGHLRQKPETRRMISQNQNI